MHLLSLKVAVANVFLLRQNSKIPPVGRHTVNPHVNGFSRKCVISNSAPLQTMCPSTPNDCGHCQSSSFSPCSSPSVRSRPQAAWVGAGEGRWREGWGGGNSECSVGPELLLCLMEVLWEGSLNSNIRVSIQETKALRLMMLGNIF